MDRFNKYIPSILLFYASALMGFNPSWNNVFYVFICTIIFIADKILNYILPNMIKKENLDAIHVNMIEMQKQLDTVKSALAIKNLRM